MRATAITVEAESKTEATAVYHREGHLGNGARSAWLGRIVLPVITRMADCILGWILAGTLHVPRGLGVLTMYVRAWRCRYAQLSVAIRYRSKAIGSMLLGVVVTSCSASDKPPLSDPRTFLVTILDQLDLVVEAHYRECAVPECRFYTGHWLDPVHDALCSDLLGVLGPHLPEGCVERTSDPRSRFLLLQLHELLVVGHPAPLVLNETLGFVSREVTRCEVFIEGDRRMARLHIRLGERPAQPGSQRLTHRVDITCVYEILLEQRDGSWVFVRVPSRIEDPGGSR